MKFNKIESCFKQMQRLTLSGSIKIIYKINLNNKMLLKSRPNISDDVNNCSNINNIFIKRFKFGY